MGEDKKLKGLSRKETWDLLTKPIDPNDIVIEEPYPFNTDLGMCLWANFGKQRMLIIKTKEDDIQELYKELKKYAEYSNVGFMVLDGKMLSPEDIEGSYKIVYEEGTPLSKKVLPGYFSQPNKMIIVENLDENSNRELLRAFLNVACIGPSGDLNNLPEDKLPKGSGFIFIDVNNFPYEKFDSISAYFRDEKWIFTYKNNQ